MTESPVTGYTGCQRGNGYRWPSLSPHNGLPRSFEFRAPIKFKPKKKKKKEKAGKGLFYSRSLSGRSEFEYVFLFFNSIFYISIFLLRILISMGRPGEFS